MTQKVGCTRPGITLLDDIESQCQQALGIESGVELVHTMETLHHETVSDEQ